MYDGIVCDVDLLDPLVLTRDFDSSVQIDPSRSPLFNASHFKCVLFPNEEFGRALHTVGKRFGGETANDARNNFAEIGRWLKKD